MELTYINPIFRFFTEGNYMETKTLEQRITDLEKKVAKYEEFFSDLDESIKKVVCDHLELSEKIEHYAGIYVELNWDKTNLGDACIDR